MSDGGEAAGGMSKSAKRRANKKARDAEAAATAAAPAAPPPAASGKKKAAEQPKPQPAAPAPPPAAGAAKAKSKAAGAAKPAAAPVEAAPTQPTGAKAKAKGKAGPKAGAKAAEAPPPAAAAPAAAAPPEPSKKTAAGKSAAKKKPGAAPAELEPPVEIRRNDDSKQNEFAFSFIDDGSAGAGDWTDVAGTSKKKEKLQAKKQQEQINQAQKMAVVQGQNIPGLNPVSVMGQGGDMVMQAQQQVKHILASKSEVAGQTGDVAVEEAAHSVTVHIAEHRAGVIIGPRGGNIAMLKEKTGVKNIDNVNGTQWLVTGDPANVEKCVNAMKELELKGITSLAYEDFAENYVSVFTHHIPDIIGKQGVTIQALKKEYKVEVTIPKTEGNETSKKIRVTLAGDKENVQKAKEAINHIAKFGYAPDTHPGQTHVEMEIPASFYRYIIGTKGSEMRHISNNYKVKVMIPRDGMSLCDNVVVCGETHDVKRAEAYINKLLYESPASKDTGDNEWNNDEEEVEDWMKAYLYKRDRK